MSGQPLPLVRTCAQGHENGPDDWYLGRPNANHPGGQRDCKRCHREVVKAWRRANPERVRAHARASHARSAERRTGSRSRDSLGNHAARPLEERVPLTPSETVLLDALARRWPSFVAPGDLLPLLGYALAVDCVRAHISKIRRKGWPIRSRRGWGYRYMEGE